MYVCIRRNVTWNKRLKLEATLLADAYLLPANFHQNLQRSCFSFSRSHIRMEYIGTFVHDNLVNGDRTKHCYRKQT